MTHKQKRLSFGQIKEVMDIPDLLDIQKSSYSWLIGDDSWTEKNPEAISGLAAALNDISPIQDFTGVKSLVLKDPRFEKEKMSVQECKERDLTYVAPLFITAEFLEQSSGEIKSQTVFMGDFPLMTESGTFIINGTERVVVSQLVRAAGIYFDKTLDLASGIEITNAKVIPARGAWLELEIDKRGNFNVRLDRRRRQSGIAFLKALGFSKEELSAEFSSFEKFNAALEKESIDSMENALLDMYRKMRPGEPPTLEASQNLLNNLFFEPKRYDLTNVGRHQIKRKLDVDSKETTLSKKDILAAVKYLFSLDAGLEDYTVDDIDHLSNRRVKTTGELVQQQFKIGLARLERVVKERMTTQESAQITPQSLINVRPVSAALREFFGSSQLSQFMDQNNPLSGLTNRRRLSALGPGGLSRDRAGLEVRDVHASHYSRMCPIESPEGPNIGLMSSLATYAKVNSMGFIEAPYKKVVDGKVTSEVHYLTADEEEKHVIAQANTSLKTDGSFSEESVLVRKKGGEVEMVDAADVDYMDVSPKQTVSVATAMIPFLEHDDANRALMGSNMQRQAVPLLKSESPFVGTGMEKRAALDSGDVLLSKTSGVVSDITGNLITVTDADGMEHSYPLRKFLRSNQGTCVNQKTVVDTGDKVQKGDLLADGSATDDGEMALGKNLLVAFMNWEGLNYEDAIILNQRLVQEDVLTSIHIEAHEIDARETKLGPEEITREVPNAGQDSLTDLDADGIIRIGAEVAPGDILVGKVTPKGETELTPEERLLRAIFGEKDAEVRDTSLRAPNGGGGIVIGVRVFSKEASDDLSPGVTKLVRIYIAQKRKIQPGDKLAGRHGNKGVISKILAPEDMPFLADGTPVDIILNPLGVPGRMNVGQIFETHLGWVAHAGWEVPKDNKVLADRSELLHGAKKSKVATPVFDGVKEKELMELLAHTLPDKSGKTLIEKNGKAKLYDGRTGEMFPSPITVGYVYILKLHHLVDEKMHARATGPYSMVTQQPLGGKAQFGGQRFGEMEVWALQAYGASHTLQEMLTVKSDDTTGRVQVYDAIVKGENIPAPGVPESFKVLLKEMQALCLNVQVMSADGTAIDLSIQEENTVRAAEELGIDLSRREK